MVREPVENSLLRQYPNVINLKCRLKYIGIFHKNFFDFCAICLLTNVARHDIIWAGRSPSLRPGFVKILTIQFLEALSYAKVLTR